MMWIPYIVMCNSFRLSSKIDPIYHVISLLYRPHFGSHGQNPTKRNTKTMSIFDKISKVCIILFQMIKTFMVSSIFYPLLEKRWIYMADKVKKIDIVSNKNNIMSKVVV